MILCVTGIDFHIGLPKELNYRVARFYADSMMLEAFKRFVGGLIDPINREVAWHMVTDGDKIFKLIDNMADFMDVSFEWKLQSQ